MTHHHHQPPFPDRRSADNRHTEELRLPGTGISLGSIDLSVITDRLEAHNEENGLGYTLARFLTGTVTQLVELSPNSKVTPRTLMAVALEEESAQRDLSRERCEAEVAPILAAIGLAIGPVRSGWGFHGVGREFDSNTLSLHIEDATRFSAYLEALDPPSISPSQKRGLSALYLTLCRQITTEYNPASGDDRFLSLVSVADSMVHNYERVGLPTTRLANFLAAIRGRYLNAYIEVEKLQLDTPPEKGDGYRLLWHRDTTPERLQAEWNRVLDVLGDLSANPNARQVYDIARHTAGTAVARSITEVSQWPSEAGETLMAHKPIFTSILQAVKLRMREF
jgi:hypothetical protein